MRNRLLYRGHRQSGNESSLWLRLHDSMLRSIAAHRGWDCLRRLDSSLALFESPVALVEHLRAGGGDLDKKDSIYRALISARRAGGSAAMLARDLLWLGLWHPIGNAARRHMARCPDQEDVASDIAIVFLSLLERSDLRGIRRLAATLVLNTERRLKDRRLMAWQRIQLERVTVDSDTPLNVPAPPLADGLAELVPVLLEIVGPDAALLLGWAVAGLTYQEVAARLRLSTRTVRRRIGRARVALRRGMDRFFEPHRDMTSVTRSLLESHRCPNHWPPSSRPGATRRVGTSWYCAPCADFLLQNTMRHERGLSCIATGAEGAAICPACLIDVFRTRGDILE